MVAPPQRSQSIPLLPLTVPAPPCPPPEAAVQFSAAVDKRKSPAEFVEHMRRQHKLIMGIGHKVKSLQNPDKRVTIVTQYAKLNFPSTTVLDYAMEVEKITTKKKVRWKGVGWFAMGHSHWLTATCRPT